MRDLSTGAGILQEREPRLPGTAIAICNSRRRDGPAERWFLPHLSNSCRRVSTGIVREGTNHECRAEVRIWAGTQPCARQDGSSAVDAFHWLVIIGLGVSWILDGLEIQIASTVGTVLQDKHALALTTGDVGTLGSVYLFGEVVGALVFGRITDMIGRKKMFVACLGLYLVASGLGGLSFNLWSLLACRFLAGMGIGGEYTAINSAIDELIPSRYRGRVDIAVNGTYWAGAMIGALSSIFLLDPKLLPVNIGWRIGFFIGPVAGLVIIYLRRTIPESPRWLMTHGREEEAETDRRRDRGARSA